MPFDLLDKWRDEDYWSRWTEAHKAGKSVDFCDRIVQVREVPDSLVAAINLAPPTRPGRADQRSTSLNALIRSRLVREGWAA